MIETISNQSIKLSRFCKDDVQLIYSAIKNSQSEISPWVSWLKPNYDLKDAEKFVLLQEKNWKTDEEYCFTIKDCQEELLGVISLHVFDSLNDVASIGYWMNSKYTKMGYCTQAVKLLVKSSFKYLNLNRIEVIVACSNKASQKVAENAGAEFESIQKNRVRVNGLTHDAHMYVFIPQK